MTDAVDTQTGWVYRSGSAPAPAPHPRPQPHARPQPQSLDQREAHPAVEVLPPAPVASPIAAPRQQAAARSGSWFESAVTLMALPVIVTAGMMLAPLAWIWAARKSSHG